MEMKSVLYSILFVFWNSGYTFLPHLHDVGTKEMFPPSQLDWCYQTFIDATRWRFTSSETNNVEGLYGVI